MFEGVERGSFAERAAKFCGEIALGTPLESEIAGGGIVRGKITPWETPSGVSTRE